MSLVRLSPRKRSAPAPVNFIRSAGFGFGQFGPFEGGGLIQTQHGTRLLAELERQSALVTSPLRPAAADEAQEEEAPRRNSKAQSQDMRSVTAG